MGQVAFCVQSFSRYFFGEIFHSIFSSKLLLAMTWSMTIPAPSSCTWNLMVAPPTPNDVPCIVGSDDVCMPLINRKVTPPWPCLTCSMPTTASAPAHGEQASTPMKVRYQTASMSGTCSRVLRFFDQKCRFTHDPYMPLARTT